MFERYCHTARKTIIAAQESARSLNHNYIGTEHLLLGLVQHGDSPASRVLTALNITPERVQGEVQTLIGPGSHTPSGHIPFTPRGKKALELALRESLQLGHTYIGAEHILLGVLREGDGVGGTILKSYNVTIQQVRQAILKELATEPEPEPEKPSRHATQLNYIATLHQRLAAAYTDLAKLETDQ